MRRIRRISVEVIRRDFSLSIERAGVPATERQAAAWTGDYAAGEAPEGSTACALCASPWFVLALGPGEEPAMIQRALKKHAIHTQLSSTGEVLVCGRSFEVHVAGAAGANKGRFAKVPKQSSGAPAGKSDSDA